MGIIEGLPESDTVVGNTFLMAAYGYLLLQGANLISDGSELLLEVLDPGLIGGLVLPILGALPDTAIIAMSGLGGTVEEAQSQVAVGMGTLAGSTVMLLTIAWAGSLTLGRCDLVERGGGAVAAKDKTLGQYNDKWDLSKTGVTTDEATRINAWPMLLSSFLYLIIQVPAFFGYTKDPGAAYCAMFASLGALAIYCIYQVISPDLQKKKMAAARAKALKHHAFSALHGMMAEDGQKLLNADNTLNREACQTAFQRFDTDGSGTLDAAEVKGLLVAITLGMSKLEVSAADVEAMLQELDKDKNGSVDFDEFYTTMQHWTAQKLAAGPTYASYQDAAASDTLLAMSHDGEEEDDDDDEDEEEEPLTPAQIYQKSALKLFMGSVVIALFADPMVDSVSAFAEATHLNTFLVSFVITPFASNASELVSSLQFASRKRLKNISLTYSQVYGAVTMNNTMCFATFMALMACRGLEWNFSAEVVVTLLSIWVMSAVALSGVTFKLWMAPACMLIYPGSLGLCFFLENVLGWK